VDDATIKIYLSAKAVSDKVKTAWGDREAEARARAGAAQKQQRQERIRAIEEDQPASGRTWRSSTATRRSTGTM